MIYLLILEKMSEQVNLKYEKNFIKDDKVLNE
jgi:hypothetical protein